MAKQQSQQSRSTGPSEEAPYGQFTDRQARGLARLGDLMADLDEALSGPLGGVVVEKVTEGTALYGRYDLPVLAENLLATVQGLQDSGVLAFVRDNAESINWALGQLPAIARTLSGVAKDGYAGDLQQQLRELLSVVRTVNALSGFVREHMTPAAVDSLVSAGRFLEDHQADEAFMDLLRTVGHLHRNGTLEAIRGLSDYLSASVASLDREALMENLMEELRDSGLTRVLRLLEGFDSAAAESRRDGGHYGGVSGLFHLLREPRVQEGLRMLAVLPGYLERTARPAGNGGVGNG
ncbi:MAG: hypothetical protein P8090_18970 [Gammaproteobacteria bacterium]|jgi:uncharacterized protein YjgD (DUF1641 family)